MVHEKDLVSGVGGPLSGRHTRLSGYLTGKDPWQPTPDSYGLTKTGQLKSCRGKTLNDFLSHLFFSKNKQTCIWEENESSSVCQNVAGLTLGGV